MALAALTALFAAMIAAGIGMGYSLYIGHNESEVEEVAEDVTEHELEELLHLPAGELKGKIELGIVKEEKPQSQQGK